MTGSDTGQPPMSQSPDAAAPAQPAPSPPDNLVASMGITQLLIVGGAAALIVLDVLFGTLLREFFVGEVTWLGAGVILVAYLLRAD
jgi:hypothetical protein